MVSLLLPLLLTLLALTDCHHRRPSYSKPSYSKPSYSKPSYSRSYKAPSQSSSYKAPSYSSPYSSSSYCSCSSYLDQGGCGDCNAKTAAGAGRPWCYVQYAQVNRSLLMLVEIDWLV